MTQMQMIEGTTEQIARQLQADYAGQRLRVFVETEEGQEEQTADTLNPPFTVRSREQLVALLREGMDSPARTFTDETLEEMRREVRKRRAAKQP